VRIPGCNRRCFQNWEDCRLQEVLFLIYFLIQGDVEKEPISFVFFMKQNSASSASMERGHHSLIRRVIPVLPLD
jgi:hypothetical protein